tara:strand:- start:140 stop:460 length:321 start_codon:yes stop_codon:yes gene_type:complete
METMTTNFEQIIKDNKVVLVDFWADWCAPCRMLGPIIDEIKSEYTDKAGVIKIDTMANSDIASQFEIRSIPTVIIFKNGEPQERIMGVRSKSFYTDKLNYYLADEN